MATCDVSNNQSTVIIWNINDAKRVCVIQSRQSITAIAFNSDCTMLVTVGIDAIQKVQLIVWDMNLMQHEAKNDLSSNNAPTQNVILTGSVQKNTALSQTMKSSFNMNVSENVGINESPTAVYRDNSASTVIAKQLSDFPISKISFSPYDDNSIISSGRENIRFWRIRKKHLPGRPIMLGESVRGHVFNHFAFYPTGLAPEGVNIQSSTGLASLVKGVSTFAYFASSKGIIIQVDCSKEVVIRSYQLFNESITSFVISHGNAITGTQNHKLVVWSLEFSDYLMEAQHEGSVNVIRVNNNGNNVLIGTAAGFCCSIYFAVVFLS